MFTKTRNTLTALIAVATTVLLAAGCSTDQNQRPDDMNPTPTAKVTTMTTSNDGEVWTYDVVMSTPEMDTWPDLLTACGLASPAAYFETDKAELTLEAKNTLNVLAECMKSGDLKGYGVYLNGHADDRGTMDHNYDLALKRSERVETYLINKGVSVNRLDAASFGELFADEDRGDLDDRRVRFRIVPVSLTKG